MNAAVKPGVVITRKSEKPFVTGRREWVKYRELAVTAATDGKMRAQVICAVPGKMEPTGWHYHVCDMHFLYVLSGWIDFEFEGAGVIRLEAGDTFLMPGGTVHQEIMTSEDNECLEVSVPANMGTVPCPRASPRRRPAHMW